VYPPIEINHKSQIINYQIKDYYLMISRIVGGKGIEEASRAFKKLGIKLKIVGEVVDSKLGESVESLGRVDDDQLPELYSQAKGFVALSRDEDFGMTVVESMMFGTPVLAYNGGGYRETVVPGKTGILVDGTDIKSVGEGIKQMEKTKWDKVDIKKWANKFRRENFEKNIRKILES
jgi:glycosyltransferase involved in cell wall biosynthesis